MITSATLLIWAAYLISLYMVIFWILVYLEEGIHDRRKKLTVYKKVSISIPAYNEEKNIGETIESVLKLDYPKSKVEIIVVNDGSTDKTSEIVSGIIGENKESNIFLINQKNSGKGAALNRALHNATGEYFVSLDADSFVKKDALRVMLPEFQEENIAAVLPLMKISNPRTLLEKIQWCEYLINFFYKRIMSVINCVHVAPGPFSVYRKKALIRVGGFDENNLTEDLEVTLRLQKNRYKIIQLLNTEVYTIAPKKLVDFYKQRNRWYKGAVLNAFLHKDMIFNKKYGDFGFIQMPRMLIAGILGVSILSLSFYNYVFKPLSEWLANLYLIDFRILAALKNFVYNFRIIDLNYTNLFFVLVAFLIGMFFLGYAHRYTRESFTRYGFVVVPAYLVLYAFLASIIWVGVTFDLARGKIQKW